MTIEEFAGTLEGWIRDGLVQVFHIEGVPEDRFEWRAFVGFQSPTGWGRVLDAHHIPGQGWRFVRWAVDEEDEKERLVHRGYAALPVRLPKPLRKQVLKLVEHGRRRLVQNPRQN